MKKQKHVAILGYGVTGRSILEFLVKKFYLVSSLNFNNSNSISSSNLYNLIINIYDEKLLDKKDIISSLGLTNAKDLDDNLEINIYADLQDLKNTTELNNFDLVVTSPGIKPEKIKNIVKKGQVISDLELFSACLPAYHQNANIFAITGTNGKSTACQLLAYILQEGSKNKIALGGNYGVPVLDFLSKTEYAECFDYVLELSSYQLALTEKFSCLAAVCLNVSIDHLDWHGNYDNYIADKLKIYKNSKYNIINLDQEYLLSKYNIKHNELKTDAEIIAYSTVLPYSELYKQTGLDISHVIHVESKNNADYICIDKADIVSILDLPIVLQTEHNLSNLLATLGLLVAKWLSEQKQEKKQREGVAFSLCNLTGYIKKHLVNIKKYTGLPHRCELITEYNQIKIFNDSKATNLDATIVAIKSVKAQIQGKIWLILGGVVKEDIDDPQSCTDFLTNLDNRIAGIIIYGKEQSTRSKLLKVVNLKQSDIEVIEITEENGVVALDKMIKLILSRTHAFDAILFSPACASFDMFNNYIHRGELFSKKIMENIALKV